MKKNSRRNNRYKVISEDLVKNLVDFLDEIQFALRISNAIGMQIEK